MQTWWVVNCHNNFSETSTLVSRVSIMMALIQRNEYQICGRSWDFSFSGLIIATTTCLVWTVSMCKSEISWVYLSSWAPEKMNTDSGIYWILFHSFFCWFQQSHKHWFFYLVLGTVVGARGAMVSSIQSWPGGIPPGLEVRGSFLEDEISELSLEGRIWARKTKFLLFSNFLLIS